jgi:hypothetical protein
MSASARKLVDPVEAFAARCDARAILVRECLMELHEAVDGLQHDAERDGLVDHLGQDFIQEILSAAFDFYARPPA